jgi:hypothetical protein
MPGAPAAYNQSIYLMVGVPYLSLGICGFLIYRGCKMNAAYRKSLEQKRDEDSSKPDEESGKTGPDEKPQD